MQKPSLADIAAFTAIARNRSFRRAADELGVTPSGLSHVISGLERHLGVRLFHRTTRSVALTEAGESFRARMDPLLEEFGSAIDEARARGGRVGGSVRISAASAAIRPLFDHVMPQMLARHPDVQVEMVADGRLVDIVQEGFDAGIRFGDAVPKDMIGVAFGKPSRFVAVAAPGYLDRNGVPEAPPDLARHQCIRMRLASGRILRWTFQREGMTQAFEPRNGLILSDVPLQLDAAGSGLGIAYVWEAAASDLLARGELRVVLEDWAPPASRLLLYFPGGASVPPALRAFIDVLRETDRASTPDQSSRQ